MSIKDRTKNMFADVLREMIKTVPLDRIRVKDLCDHCGVERQTFYYHFKDKYDLIAWIYLQDIAFEVDDDNFHHGEEHTATVLRRLKAKFSFYKKAFADRSQNALGAFFHATNDSYTIDYVKDYLSVDTLDTETTYTIRSYVFACSGHMLEWFEEKTDYSPEEFAHLLYITMPDILKAAIREQSSRRMKG